MLVRCMCVLVGISLVCMFVMQDIPREEGSECVCRVLLWLRQMFLQIVFVLFLQIHCIVGVYLYERRVKVLGQRRGPLIIVAGLHLLVGVS